MSLFEEADYAADILRKKRGFVAEDLRIMFRLAQRDHHPDYSGAEFEYLFDVWHDGYQARLAAEKAAAHARMLALLKERDELTEERSRCTLAERAAVTERIGAITQEIAAMMGPERQPPGQGAQWA
jgi:hypothetical protein